MNSIVLLGRTTAPIELKQTPTGKSVVRFSLAVRRPFAKDTTDFFTICAWDKQAETLSRYVGKGDQICIRGYLQTRSWEDANGSKRYATDVVAQDFDFCEAKNNSEGNSYSNNSNVSQGKNTAPTYLPDAYTAPRFEEVEDDGNLPF